MCGIEIGKLVLLCGLIGVSCLAGAHGDEDHHHHEPTAAVATTPLQAATRPRRLADGSVWAPKPAQRQLRLRTQLAQQQALSVSLSFNGKVIADPNASGRVQAIQHGRLQAGPNGFPAVGQRVLKGETLAWLRPVENNLDRADRQAQLADFDAQIAIARSRVGRLDQLEGAVPQKDIEAARHELAALQQRRSAIGSSLTSVEKLSAPISGVIVAAHAVPGQVVDARDVLFELIDPARLWVEALSYSPMVTDRLTQASARFPGGSAKLVFIGVSRQLREQAQPVLFRVAASSVPLAIGQLVTVMANTTDSLDGVAVPRSALVRNAAGETVVWLHAKPEHFVPRTVQWSPLDADKVVITQGLNTGERVVTEGASLLAQMR